MSKPFKPVLSPEDRDELIADLCDENNKLRAKRDELRNEWGLAADAVRRAIGFWQQAEAERDALRAQLDEACEALEPFATLAAELEYEGSKWRDHETQWMQTFNFKLEPTVGTLRRARAVYEKIKEANDGKDERDLGRVVKSA